MATVQRKKRVRISPQQQQQKLSRESRMTSGPTAWANDSHKAIEESTQLVRRAQKSCERSRSKDPLPGLRDVVAELSNDQARKHFRDVRKVTHLLMDTLIDTNTEIKSMTRAKEALEKGQGRIVKDMKVNSTSRQLRNKRPDKERVEAHLIILSCPLLSPALFCSPLFSYLLSSAVTSSALLSSPVLLPPLISSKD